MCDVLVVLSCVLVLADARRVLTCGARCPLAERPGEKLLRVLTWDIVGALRCVAKPAGFTFSWRPVTSSVL